MQAIHSPMVTPKRWLRPIYFTAGVLFLGVGVVGVFLPLVPTTGPLLLAAFFLARSSERVHTWLVQHPRFGRFIADFQAGRGIPLRTKAVAVTAMVVAFAYSTWVLDHGLARALTVVVGVLAIGYVLRLPTADSGRP